MKRTKESGGLRPTTKVMGMKNTRALALALFVLGVACLATADPRMENRDGIVHAIIDAENQDDEIKIGGVAVPIYVDAFGFAQGYARADVAFPCGILPSEDLVLTDADSEGACTMVDDGGSEYTAYRWSSSLFIGDPVQGVCVASFAVDCVDGFNDAQNLDPEALADWDSNGGASIVDNGDGSITASGFTSGNDSAANSLLSSAESIEGRRFQTSYELKAPNAGCKVELRLQRLTGGDGAPIVNESALDVTLDVTWQAFMTVGTGAAGNMGLKALITGGINSGVVCASIDVRRRFISEIN